MLTSLAFIFLVGLAAAAICQQLKLPRYYWNAHHRNHSRSICS